MVKEFRKADFSRRMPWFVQINDVSHVENLPRSTSTLLQEWDFQLKNRYRISVMKCWFRVLIIKLNCWQVLVAFYYRHPEINTQYFKKQYFKKQYFKETIFQRSVRKSGDMGKRSTHTTHKTQQIACYFIRIYHRGRLCNNRGVETEYSVSVMISYIILYNLIHHFIESITKKMLSIVVNVHNIRQQWEYYSNHPILDK